MIMLALNLGENSTVILIGEQLEGRISVVKAARVV
jgi:hypothetical protein